MGRLLVGLRGFRPMKTRVTGQVVWQCRWPSIATEVFPGVIVVPVSM
jgi:hypothetical protein